MPEITKFTHDRCPLTKRFELDGATGKVIKTTAARMCTGTAQRVQLAGVREMAEFIAACAANEAHAHCRSDAPPRLGKCDPWPTWPTKDGPDLTHMSRKVKEVIRTAGLRDQLTVASFRHGGFTEAADADLSDAQMRAQGRHKSAKVLPRYAKRTRKQVAEGAEKRRAVRTKNDQDSE